MTKHQAIATESPARLLSAFWRRGRRQFVPLTANECRAAGIRKVDIEVLSSAGLIKDDGSFGSSLKVWSITDKGAEFVDGADPAKATPRHEAMLTALDDLVKSGSRANAARRNSAETQLACLMSLRDGPLSGGKIGRAIGRKHATSRPDCVLRLIEAGLVIAKRNPEFMEGMKLPMMFYHLTDAGRARIEEASK